MLRNAAQIVKSYAEIGDALVCIWGGLRGAVGLALALIVFEEGDVCDAVQNKVGATAIVRVLNVAPLLKCLIICIHGLQHAAHVRPSFAGQVLMHTAGIVVLTLAVNGTSMSHLLVFVGLDTVPASRLVVFNQVFQCVSLAA